MNIAPKIIATTSLSLSLIASTSYGMDQLTIEGPLQTRPHLVDTSELDNPVLLEKNKPALLEDARKQEGLATLTQGEFTEPTIDRRSMFHEAGSATTKFKYLSYKKEYILLIDLLLPSIVFLLEFYPFVKMDNILKKDKYYFPRKLKGLLLLSQ